MSDNWSQTPGDASSLAQHLTWIGEAQRFAYDLHGATQLPLKPTWAPRMSRSWTRLLETRAATQKTYQAMLNVVGNWLQAGDDDGASDAFTWDEQTGTYQTTAFLALYFALEVNSPAPPSAGQDPYAFFRDALAKITPNDGARWFYGQCIENPALLQAYASHQGSEIRALLDPAQGIADGSETIGTISVPDYEQLQSFLVALDLPGQKAVTDWLSTQKNPAWTDSSVPGQFVCNTVQVYRFFQNEAMRKFADWSGNYTNVVIELSQWDRGDTKVPLGSDDQGKNNPRGPEIDLGFNEGIQSVRIDGKPIRAPKYDAAGDKIAAYPTLSWSEDDGNPFSATLYLGQVFDFTAEQGWIGNLIWGAFKVPASYGNDFFGIQLDFGGNDHAEIAVVAKTKPATPPDKKTPWYDNEWFRLIAGFLGGWIAFKLMDFMWEKLKRRWSRDEKVDPAQRSKLRTINDRVTKRLDQNDVVPPRSESLSQQQKDGRRFKEDADEHDVIEEGLEQGSGSGGNDIISGGGDDPVEPIHDGSDHSSTGTDPDHGETKPPDGGGGDEGHEGEDDGKEHEGEGHGE